MQKIDFEKNVQQRMDELQLYPSAEVWPEVQRRIRKEKKRRWFIFWFLFPALLAGGGKAIYFLTTTNRKNISSNQVLKQIEKPLAEKSNENALVNDVQATTTFSNDSPGIKKDILPIPGFSKEANPVRTEQEKTIKPVISFEDAGGAKKKISSPDKTEDQPSVIGKKEKVVPADMQISVQNPVKATVIKDENRAGVTPATVNGPPTKVYEAKQPEKIIAKTDKPEPVVPVIDSAATTDQPKLITLIADSNATTNSPDPLAKKNKTKWDFGVTVLTGLSNRACGLSLGSEKSNSSPALSAGGPAQLASYGGNGNSKPGLFWEAGAYIQSNSKKKTNISFGLSVSSFTNRQPTGSFADSAISADANGFYRNGNSLKYNNRYYYLQLPIVFHWQVNKGKKFPLIWQNGLSPSFLLGSNALIYNYNRNIFYRDKSSVSKAQLAFRSGLYSRFGTASKKTVTGGIFLNYNFTGLQKAYEYNRNHLLSFGVQLMIPLKKN